MQTRESCASSIVYERLVFMLIQVTTLLQCAAPPIKRLVTKIWHSQMISNAENDFLQISPAQRGFPSDPNTTLQTLQSPYAKVSSLSTQISSNSAKFWKWRGRCWPL